MPLEPHPPHALRVVIQQPALPKYRIPVFRELARRPQIELTVIHGEVPGGPPSVAPVGFASRRVLERRLALPGRTVAWHGPQWDEATRARADVLVLSWNLNYASLIPGLLRARRNGVGTVLWGHGYSTDEARWREVARRAVSELADAVVFYAAPTAAEYRARSSSPERIFVAPNALDQEPIQAAREAWLSDPGRLAAFRRERGLGDGPVLLFVARLDAEKRVDLLLRAAARLRTEHPGLRVLVVGSGDDLPRLRELAVTLRLGPAVEFLGSIYEEDHLAPIFLSSDVFCFPGSIGLSILHAFGYGLPVVTHGDRKTHHPEIAALRHGENGLLFEPPGDVDALVASLRTLLSDPSRRLAMGRAAHRTATEEFTVSAMVDGAERAIRFAAAAAARRAG